MENDKDITITRQEYFELQCDSTKLAMLEAGGVDNWDWYGESLHPDEGPTILDQVDELKKSILGES